MSPEAQRIAIAEACGWKRETRKKYGGEPNIKGWGKNQHLDRGDGDRHFTTFVSTFPDYLNDLNAMHEAEEVLNEDQRKRFILYLMGDSLGCLPQHYWLNSHATAAQRSEAFLKTIGKWKDQ